MSPTARRLILRSTRSSANENAWRDMHGFDPNEELARLQRAIIEIAPSLSSHKPFTAREKSLGNGYGSGRRLWRGARPVNARTTKILAFIAEAAFNIDEYIARFGVPPLAWRR